MVTACSQPGVRINNATVKVEFAEDEKAWERGLMQHDKLREGNGMLFVFEDEASRHFWMKNMSFPIDILYFDKDKRFINAYEFVVPCRTPICEVYTSHSPAMYVLEVPPGFVQKYDVKKDDVFIIT